MLQDHVWNVHRTRSTCSWSSVHFEYSPGAFDFQIINGPELYNINDPGSYVKVKISKKLSRPLFNMFPHLKTPCRKQRHVRRISKSPAVGYRYLSVFRLGENHRFVVEEV